MQPNLTRKKNKNYTDFNCVKKSRILSNIVIFVIRELNYPRTDDDI